MARRPTLMAGSSPSDLRIKILEIDLRGEPHDSKLGCISFGIVLPLHVVETLAIYNDFMFNYDNMWSKSVASRSGESPSR
jgi:hypothetical protein